MGDESERARFLTQVKKACRIGRKLRDLKIRPYGIIRIDSATSVEEWAKDPRGEHQADRADVPRGLLHSRGFRRAARGRRGNLLGWHAQLAAERAAAGTGGPAANAGLPGRHGAHHALHHGLQRAGGPPAAGELRLGADRTSWPRPIAKWRAPCVRGPSIYISPRTMEP